MTERSAIAPSWWKQLGPAFIITRREVRDQFRDWRIIFPIFGLTLVFPFIMNWTAQQMLNFVSKYGASLIADRLVPFLLMVVGFFPISFSLVIALESFVGEKERNSIEPLLNTPLSDWQLYLGKLMAATAPPLLSSFLGMTVYLIGLLINHIPWPVPGMLAQIYILTTVQALMMVSGAVVVSAQATSVRAANLLASFIIIPSSFLIQWEALVMFWGDFSTLWWVVFGVVVLTFLLVRIGLAQFRREELLGHEIDMLRLAFGWGVFRRSFWGGARNVWDWYRRVLPPTLKRLRLPFALVTLIGVAALVIGVQQASRFPLPLNRIGLGDWKATSLQGLENAWPMLNTTSVLLVWWQNARVLLLALILGIFTFGVVGVMPLMATLGITGYLMAILSGTGIPLTTVFAGLILPHGIIEIPTAILATAAVLQIGAVLAKPIKGKTITEVWLEALADWSKVMVGVVIPLLLVAAMVEVWITPRIAMYLFTH